MGSVLEASHSGFPDEELKVFSAQHKLSDRETEVLRVLIEGYTSSEAISRKLGISPNTTNNHIKSILDKTRASSKTELLSLIIKNHFMHCSGVRREGGHHS